MSCTIWYVGRAAAAMRATWTLPLHLSSTRSAAARTSMPLASLLTSSKTNIMAGARTFGQPPISAAVIWRRPTMRQRGFVRITTAVFARRMSSEINVPNLLAVFLTITSSGQAQPHQVLTLPLPLLPVLPLTLPRLTNLSTMWCAARASAAAAVPRATSGRPAWKRCTMCAAAGTVNTLTGSLPGEVRAATFGDDRSLVPSPTSPARGSSVMASADACVRGRSWRKGAPNGAAAGLIKS